MNRVNSRDGFGLDDGTVNIDVCIIIINYYYYYESCVSKHGWICGWLPTIVNAVCHFFPAFVRDKTAEDMRTTLVLLCIACGDV